MIIGITILGIVVGVLLMSIIILSSRTNLLIEKLNDLTLDFRESEEDYANLHTSMLRAMDEMSKDIENLMEDVADAGIKK
jgi:hypothetical protein